MKKIKKCVALLLCMVFVLSGTVCPPVPAEAFVLEAAAGATLAELLEMFVLSFGSIYLLEEGAEEIYENWIQEEGSETYEEVMTSLKINCGYWAYINGEMTYLGPPDQDPDPSKEPDGDETGSSDVKMPKLAMIPAVLATAWEYWSFFFKKQEEDERTQSGRMYKYEIGGAISDVYFGGYVKNAGVEAAYESAGITYRNGVMQTAYELGTGYTSGYYRFYEDVFSNADYVPGLMINPFTSGGKDAYQISYCLLSHSLLFNGNSNIGLSVDNGSYAAVARGSYSRFDKKEKCQYDYPAKEALYGIYDNVPGSVVWDKTTGKIYYWNGARLYERQYNASMGTYTDTGLDRPYIYTSDGVYRDLGDLYEDASGAALIVGLIANLQHYLETRPPDEVPMVDASDLESLQQDLEDEKAPYVSDYPMQQPETPELPSEYPQNLEAIFQKFMEEHLKEPDTDTKPEQTEAPPGSSTIPGTGTEDLGENGEKEDKDDYSLSLIDFFPFCLPKDLYLLIKGLDAEPIAPKFEWVIPTMDSQKVRDNRVEIDLSLWDDVAGVVRIMEKIGFVFLLVIISRRIVKGG